MRSSRDLDHLAFGVQLHVRSRRAGERVLQALRGCYAVAALALAKLRERIRQLTRRTRGSASTSPPPDQDT